VLAVAGVFLVVASVLVAGKLAAALALRKDIAAARRLMAEGKVTEARDPLERWLKARPDSGEAFFLLARAALHFQAFDQGLQLLARAEALGYPPAPIVLERARALVRQGRHHEAISVLNPLVLAPAARPDPAADQVLAQCYLETFQLGAAAKVIERWIRDAPRDPKPFLWKAQLDRRTDAGLHILTDDYEKALAVDPRCSEALLSLGEMYLRAHRIGDAKARYSAYLARFPNAPAAHVGMGKTLAEQGDLAAAIEHLDRAAALDPHSADPLLEKARIDFRTGRLESALSLLDRALALEKKEVALEDGEIELHYLRGLVLARLNRKDEAVAEKEVMARLLRDQQELAKLLEALQVAPDNTAHQYNAARWLFEHDHPQEGMRWAEKILREHPSHAETNQLLADYYRKRGDVGLANYYRLQAATGAGQP
jgi:tetratricopeptide (TPR) repeat protein